MKERFYKLICRFAVYNCNLNFMNTRIKKWMESQGLKSSEFADKIGVNRSTISHILSGRNKPSIEFFEKLLKTYTSVNSNWLITGLGYMTTQKDIKEVQLPQRIGKVVVFYNDQSYEEVVKEDK